MHKTRTSACTDRSKSAQFGRSAWGKASAIQLTARRTVPRTLGLLFRGLIVMVVFMGACIVPLAVTSRPAAAASTYSETVGPGGAGTFTYYQDAGDPQGPRISQYLTVQVTCQNCGLHCRGR